MVEDLSHLDPATRKIVRRIDADLAKLDAEKQQLLGFRSYVIHGAPAATTEVAHAGQFRMTPSPAARSPKGSLKVTVKKAMSDLSDSLLTVNQIDQAIRQHGWDSASENSLHVLRRVLRELVDEGFLVRVDARHYRMAKPPMFAQPESATGGA
jgi:hypothetical protein